MNFFAICSAALLLLLLWQSRARIKDAERFREAVRKIRRAEGDAHHLLDDLYGRWWCPLCHHEVYAHDPFTGRVYCTGPDCRNGREWSVVRQ